MTRWKAGDKVCALVNGGGYAQYCIAEEPIALPIPAGLDMVHAGAVPETFFTVWNNVFERGRLAAGEWFLVHGGTSGIGTTAIQLAKALRRQGDRHRRLGREVQGVPRASAPTGPSTTRRRTSSPRLARPPAARAST